MQARNPTLTWNTTNAQSCVIEPDIGTVALNGTITVTPTQTTTYTITATGVDGATVTNSVTVTVNTPAPVVSITAEPGSIVAGKASTLTWDATNADTVNIDPDIGDVAAGGKVSVSPTSTTTYTITATGAGGTTTDAISISVAAAPADIDDGLSIDEQQGGGGLVGETVCILKRTQPCSRRIRQFRLVPIRRQSVHFFGIRKTQRHRRRKGKPIASLLQCSRRYRRHNRSIQRSHADFYL